MMQNPCRDITGADPGIFERGGPKSLKMAFECSFQSLSYKSFAKIPQKGGPRPPGPLP